MLLNNVLIPLPRNWAPTAMPRAMKTTSIAYSVAVAPLSSPRKRLSKLSMERTFKKVEENAGNRAPFASTFYLSMNQSMDEGVVSKKFSENLTGLRDLHG